MGIVAAAPEVEGAPAEVPWPGTGGAGESAAPRRRPRDVVKLVGGFLVAWGSLAAADGPLRREVLASGWREPIAMDAATDGRVYVAERRGRIRCWEPGGGTTREVGQLDVFTGPEDGILGMVLDPGFATNRWIYLYHSTPKVPENRLSRFGLTNGILDVGSQRVLLRIPTLVPKPNHSGGGLDFDGAGNLLLGVGDYTLAGNSDGFAPLDGRPGKELNDSRRTAGNTADWHGKILRIHPEPDGTYTIPQGNLFPAGTSRTLPEIYAMGVRNPFRLAVDRPTGRLFFGDVGPDAVAPDAKRGPAGFDEFNVTRSAGNFGWPFFSADNRAYVAFDFATRESGATFDPARPTNDSPNNTGLRELPPARPALIWYPPGPSTRWPVLGGGARSAMAGPVFHAAAHSGSPLGWPARYDGAVVLWDWERSRLWAAWLDAADRLKRLERVAEDQAFNRPIAARFGRDGALYLVEWGSKWWDNTNAALVRVR